MCEIMVVGDGEVGNIITGAKTMYERNNDGFGIVAVYRDGEKFQYDVFKAAEPNWREVRHFISACSSNGVWRFVIHARLATCGGTGYKQAHPINIIDDDVEIEWVIHNGHVQDYKLRENIKDSGHVLNTGVDSELIAHAHKTMPRTLSDDDFDEPAISGQLHYLLFAEDRILIRDGGKYYMSDDMQMSCRNDWVNEAFEKETGFRLYKPDGSYDEAEIERSGYGSFGGVSKSTTTVYGNWGTSEYKQDSRTRSSSGRSNRKLPAGDDDSDDSSGESCGWGAGHYENTDDEEHNELQVREYFTNNPPHYWEVMNEQFVCTIHNREFGLSQCCEDCVEMIDPDDLKYFEQEENRKKAQQTRSHGY